MDDKPFNIAKNQKYDGYQRSLATMAYNFFDIKIAGPGAVQNKNMPNQQLAEEFHKPNIRKF